MRRTRSLVRSLLFVDATMKLALAALILAAACGTENTSSQELLTRLPGECGMFETHVVGVDHPLTPADSGPILLRVERPGNHTIVVSAREAATWKIVATNGARVTTVYAVGKAKQTVIAPANTQVMSDPDPVCGYSWPGNATCDTKGLLRFTSVRLNKHATSFHGCLAASQFTIGEDMAVTSDCTSLERAGNPQDDIITRCDPDKDESDCGDVVLY